MKTALKLGLSTLAIAGGALGMLSFTEYADAQGSKYSSARCEKEARTKFAGEGSEWEKLNSELEKVEKAKEVLEAEEGRRLLDQMNSWDEFNNYTVNRDNLMTERADRIESVKELIGYQNQIDAAEDRFESGMDDLKYRLQYDEKMENFDRCLKKVKSDYSRQETLLTAFSDSESNAEVLKAAKELKNNAINGIKKDKTDLENRFNSAKRELEIKKRNEIKAIDANLKKETDLIEDDIRAKVQILDKEYYAEKSRVVSEIKSMRTPEENGIADHIKDLEEQIDKIQSDAQKYYAEKYGNLTFNDRIAIGLEEKGVTKTGFVAAGLLPLIPAGIGIGYYLKWVADVASKIGGNKNV